MNAACYIRVSTDEQIENYSIDAQTERLTNYCKAKDWTTHKFYTDPGYSGANLNRPGLQQLISDIYSHSIDLVVVYKLDRLSRSQKDTLYLIEDIFLKNNVAFVSLNENFDTSTPFGRAMIGILSVFAQLEREQIKERTTMGRQARAKDGYFHGGSYPPIGYDYIDGKLILNEYEANQVQKIFDLRNKGYTLHAIAKYMHEHYKNKYSDWNSVISVSNCLKNSIYIGKIKFAGKEYNGLHQAIIDADTFYLANSYFKNDHLMNELIPTQKTPFKYKELLSGLLYCGHCGAKYFCNHGNYSCYSRAKSSKNRIIDANCKNENWNIEELNQIVINEINHLSIQFSTDHADKQVNTHTLSNEMQAISSRILKYQGEIEKVLDLYQINQIDLTLVSERLQKLEQEKKGCEDTLKKLEKESQSHQLSIDDAKRILKMPNYIFETKTIAEKRNFLHMLLSKIVLDGTKITFEWNISL